MSTLLIEELSRERVRRLLQEAEMERRAREVYRSHPRRVAGTAGPGRVRRAAGRWLISAGARLAGPEAARVMR